MLLITLFSLAALPSCKNSSRKDS